jgi:CheY-like chemotaxis protein
MGQPALIVKKECNLPILPQVTLKLLYFLSDVEQVLSRVAIERVCGKQRTGDLARKGSPKERDLINQTKETKGTSARILLVEDNLVNQKLASTMLSRAGYQIETANNGKEAVEKYKESRTDNGTQNDTDSTSSDKAKQDRYYNLIFMDMQMPEMDGLTATQEIRKWEAENGCRVPVIAMTANASEGDREKCLEAGMDDYLTKPINKDEVFALIEKWKWIGS